MQRGEGDEEGFRLDGGRRVHVGNGDGQDGVANLLDDNGALEARLLGIVAFEMDAGANVSDGIGCSWGMMAGSS